MNPLERFYECELPPINRFLEAQALRLDASVRPTVRHVLEAGGKRFRPVLTILMARALGHGGDDILPLACSLELLHSATLLHDDIVDEARLRRGRQSAHLLFGATHTILVGDALLALANRLVAEYGIPALTRHLSEALLRTATGEIQEIAHLRDTNLTIATYYEIITGKTAFLIQAACRCGAVYAGAASDLEEAAADFGLSLGIAFQLVDDALDYTSPSTVSGKPAASDLREGKVTLPLILYLADLDPEERRRVADDFVTDRLSPEDLENLRQTIVSGGYADKTREAAASYLARAETALAPFPASPERELLAQALGPMLDRRK
ncbi:polyprenyl synthetase family protein [Desulfolutivibrio sulfoxidireducens]|uniref:polyprenyl synthetase family protein n=1 Tax=Desulfolutivibrio sulfoxidireducens TaxID=2773299 RepID=UPI00159CFEBD|nr:polyprenyl synthetase family protein [Desulfolutivibrio sulfoxidireducens]QLA17278.1 polyprenyl synthetase family protein [Desulfolutivibrio sulfoxidireducens]QLA20845.1 polyprenyl synthetase family protein [Desulfolutivibrio sulfoxidireducens]